MAGSMDYGVSTASATGSSKRKGSSGTGKLQRVEIQLTDDGGFILEKWYSKGNKDYFAMDAKKSVHENKKDLMAAVEKCL